MISIVDADPDLGDLLSPGDLERARREALTRVSRLSPGAWDAADAHEPAEHHRGFLIVDGLLSRTVNVLGKHCVELVGHGDVMRPWSWDETGSHVRAEVGWQVMEETQLAVLDHAFVLRIVPWPSRGWRTCWNCHEWQRHPARALLKHWSWARANSGSRLPSI